MKRVSALRRAGTHFSKLRACAAWAIYAALTKLQSNLNGEVQANTFTSTCGLYATVANAREAYVAGANSPDIFIKNESPIRKRGTIKNE